LRLVSFTTQARHGDARAPGALKRILKSQSLPTAFACAEQVHGVLIQVVPALSKPKRFLRADGLLTAAENQPLAIFTADCVPLFLCADEGRVIGILHAGWRGVRGQILAQAVQLLRRKWRLKPSQVVAWPGPHIRPCCFEVRWDVARYFPASRRRSGGRGRIDLAEEIKRQARRLGVRWVSKKVHEDCTMHGSRHFSYRRDKTAKRQVSVILKRKEP
jgi:YfiH family protein